MLEKAVCGGVSVLGEVSHGKHLATKLPKGVGVRGKLPAAGCCWSLKLDDGEGVLATGAWTREVIHAACLANTPKPG